MPSRPVLIGRGLVLQTLNKNLQSLASTSNSQEPHPPRPSRPTTIRSWEALKHQSPTLPRGPDSSKLNSVPRPAPPPTHRPGSTPGSTKERVVLRPAVSRRPSHSSTIPLVNTTSASHTFGGCAGCVLLRKEVIQPHLPVRLPCYDFVPIASPTFDGSLHKG